jgi:hypothetical protein
MSFLINPFAFAVAGGDFESIATVTVGSGGASSIELTSIPSTYQHLQIRYVARSDRAGAASDNLKIQINDDTNVNLYVRYHRLSGTGSGVSASNQLSGISASIELPQITADTAVANAFGVAVVDILDYASTSKFKVLRSFGGNDRNGGGSADLMSGLWMQTSAVSKLVINAAANTILQHSVFALYGVKAP